MDRGRDSLARESRGPWGPSRRGARTHGAPRQPAVAPPCRLRLEGGEDQEARCEILELSAEGVTIAISDSKPAHQGQHGQLLIGPAQGDHYALPVAVRWVQPATNISILGLLFHTTEHWAYNRG